MKSFYAYGRSHFTWTTSSGSSAANGGLMKGAVSAGACGAFNANFRWLAEKVFGITGFSQGQYLGQFITQPGSVRIDSRWVGNVCTATGGYSVTKSYKFKDHYWAVQGGTNYDVCYNHTFGSATEIIWTKLVAASADVLKKARSRRSRRRSWWPTPWTGERHRYSRGGGWSFGWPDVVDGQSAIATLGWRFGEPAPTSTSYAA